MAHGPVDPQHQTLPRPSREVGVENTPPVAVRSEQTGPVPSA